MNDKDMAELWPFKVRRVSYSSVSCIRDQRVRVSKCDISDSGNAIENHGKGTV